MLQETSKSSGDITSNIRLSSNEALDAGIRFLGKNYNEIGKRGSGLLEAWMVLDNFE